MYLWPAGCYATYCEIGVYLCFGVIFSVLATIKMDAAARQQVMLSQFIYVAGCLPEQARQLLTESNWHFEASDAVPLLLSVFTL